MFDLQKDFYRSRKVPSLTDDEKSMTVKLNSEGMGIRAIARVLNRESHMGIFNFLKRN